MLLKNMSDTTIGSVRDLENLNIFNIFENEDCEHIEIIINHLRMLDLKIKEVYNLKMEANYNYEFNQKEYSLIQDQMNDLVSNKANIPKRSFNMTKREINKEAKQVYQTITNIIKHMKKLDILLKKLKKNIKVVQEDYEACILKARLNA
ncbi:MAG: hypothetical protein ACJA1D_001840 [Polaribacter sp.]|jgi:hypothetical protein